MKRPTILPVLVLCAMLSFSCSTESVDDKAELATEQIVVPQAKEIEIEILELINDYRINNGMVPLNGMDLIKSQAYSHTDYMVAQNSVSHDYFYQRKAFLMDHTGAVKVNENVAYGFTSAESVVNAWINSDAHRENIIGDFTDFDVSAEKNSQGKWYFTNIFIKK
ncbi:CAP domain-containing protein [Mangrovimonas futianensis]|uniref:CAP domain-containing protein n=1 Tax=Mangrovimonas futianensis TaxID=2895523 RepID=UPI001E65504D|nr:CAP domain-containing protein [Mangrovimonas futianensis]MCF1422991.1 CAP domain-containing protein [Mangrovimonas futianensis]